MEAKNPTESNSNSTGDEKQKIRSRKSVSFHNKDKKNKSKKREQSWTSTSENGTDSDLSYRPSQSTSTKKGRGRPKKAAQDQQRMEMDWEEANSENSNQARTYSASVNSTPKQIPVNAETPQTSTPTIDVASLLQSTLAQRIQVNTQAPINFPPPKKFDRSQNVHEWIRDTDLYIQLSNIESRKKQVYWTFLDLETWELLEAEEAIEDDETAVEQMREKLISLFGRTGKGNKDYVREFTSRRQQHNENVRLYCTELQRLCKRAFPDMNNFDSYVIDRFIEGISNRDLRLQLAVSKPRSVVAMLEIASRFEEAYTEMRGSRIGQAQPNTSQGQNPAQTAAHSQLSTATSKRTTAIKSTNTTNSS
jgi:hypothetical protein